ncbi:MAG: helix-hairpin-helix domain-containing protein [Thermoleophilaceae bacterium]
MTRRPALALIAVVVAGQGFASTAAGSDTPPSITLRPSRAEGVLKGPLRVGPFGLINGTQISYGVTVFPIFLGQKRDGSLFVRDDPAALLRAKRYMRADLRRFPFPPGSSRTSPMLVRRVPRAHSLYGGLVFQARPKRTKAASPQLSKVFRLTATVLLDPPQPRRHVRFAPELLRAEQAGARKLRVAVGVKNLGNYYTPARGVFRIRAPDGHIVLRQGLRSLRILPGATVDLDGIVTKLLPKGDYSLDAVISGSGARATTHATMRLLGPSTVAFRDATLSAPKVPTAYLGQPVNFHADFLNTGNLRFAPRAVVEVRRLRAGHAPGAPTHVPARATTADPGRHGDVRATLRLHGRGTFELTVRLFDGPRQLDSASVSVTPVKKPSLATRIGNSIKDHPLTWVLGLVGLLVLLVAAFLAYALVARRRREQPRIAPAATSVSPEPLPPAAAAPSLPVVPPPSRSNGGAVDLNRAGVDELMQLPGVGRQAAERIVAYREAHGPFSTIEDLQAIEGFHSERVQRLAGHVAV